MIIMLNCNDRQKRKILDTKKKKWGEITSCKEEEEEEKGNRIKIRKMIWT